LAHFAQEQTTGEAMNTPIEHLRAGGRAVLAAAIACAMLTACGGASGDDAAAVAKTSPARSSTGTTPTKPPSTQIVKPTATATAAPAAATASTEGRLLASNCFQCHGTNGTGGFDSIRGGEADEIQEFLTKTASRDIMAAHAQGYTPAQLQKIIAYLQQ
jgi:mono/diheme cytochrome c family protein